MSEIKLISPLLDHYDVGGSISEHNGVSCYPAMKKESNDRYIIKKVSIPASQTQLDALLLTGAYPDAVSALSYYQSVANDTVSELETLRQLSQLSGFLGFEDWQVCPKEDSVGFDVYMISTYKYTLRKYLQHRPITHLAAVNLGMDICAALSNCRKSGYLYADLKPNNIYVVDDHSFCIGDLGFIHLDTLKYTTLPDRYCSQYTAPEALDAFSTLSPTLDTYALGLILYQAYNGGELPVKTQDTTNEKFPAPLYADYEMAEIILKACDPMPENRWQDPGELEQALISYMQRNGANDTPITPPVIEIPEELLEFDLNEVSNKADSMDEVSENVTEVEEVSEFIDDFDNISDVDLSDIDLDNIPDLAEFISDETTPENNITDVAYEEVSDELSEILSQADELVAHPAPDPVVTPEATPIEDIVVDEETENADEQIYEENNEDVIDSEENKDISLEETIIVSTSDEVIPSTEETDDNSVDESDACDKTDEIVEEDPEENDESLEQRPRSKKLINWLLTIIIFLLIASIAAVGLFYYKNIYLLPIDNITVDGNDSSMVVQVDSDIEESLLSVICSDSHGNQISAPVVNGSATFANLTPDTAYTVRILVDGFHRLTGETAASYSTPAQTNVIEFSAITGAEDGSVNLRFTVEGPDTGNWKIQYFADEEDLNTVDAYSNMVKLTGLTVGKEYTFILMPGEDMYVTGVTEIKFTASNLVYAENVNITSCVNNQLTVVWDAPAGVDVPSWTVRCYNDDEYNQTTITAETTAIFENIDPTSSYTVEVAAAGMSVNQRAFMTENAVTISDFTADASASDVLNLSWNSSNGIPEGGWVLLYSVEGTDTQGSVACTDNSAQISPYVPGTTYNFKLQQANGIPVLSAPLSCQTPEAQDFSGYGMTRGTMSFQLCKRPEGESWSWTSLSSSDFTSTFVSGQSISVLGQLHGKYGVSDDMITSLFVIKNAEGQIISHSSFAKTWNDMWEMSYSEIDIPQVPSIPGDYTVTIYFNGNFVTEKAFTISN